MEIYDVLQQVSFKETAVQHQSWDDLEELLFFTEAQVEVFSDMIPVQRCCHVKTKEFTSMQEVLIPCLN